MTTTLPQIALLAFERVARGDTVDTSAPTFVPPLPIPFTAWKWTDHLFRFYEPTPRSYLRDYIRDRGRRDCSVAWKLSSLLPNRHAVEFGPGS